MTSKRRRVDTCSPGIVARLSVHVRAYQVLQFVERRY
jgi:hypothetical protein